MGLTRCYKTAVFYILYKTSATYIVTSNGRLFAEHCIHCSADSITLIVWVQRITFILRKINNNSCNESRSFWLKLGLPPIPILLGRPDV